MVNSLVSIIVPVYNAEKYICRCIDSILAQSYKNIELLLVDDGSPDKCGIICDEYSQKDKRIKVFHQNNKGVSCARQKGLDEAIGDYIIHVDPDDWIEPDEIESLYNKAIEEKADMVICDYWYESRDENHIERGATPNIDSISLRKQIISLQRHGSCCNKLIKYDVIKQANCGFFPSHISYCEDILFNIRLLSNDIKIAYLPRALYHYNLSNPNGVTMSFSEKKLHSWIEVISELEKILSEEDNELLYAQKKEVLYIAFRLKKTHLLKQHYKDIHDKIILESGKYSWHTPISSNLLLALKGYPRIALLLYHIQMKIIIFVKKLKRR